MLYSTGKHILSFRGILEMHVLENKMRHVELSSQALFLSLKHTFLLTVVSLNQEFNALIYLHLHCISHHYLIPICFHNTNRLFFPNIFLTHHQDLQLHFPKVFLNHRFFFFLHLFTVMLSLL